MPVHGYGLWMRLPGGREGEWKWSTWEIDVYIDEVAIVTWPAWKLYRLLCRQRKTIAKKILQTVGAWVILSNRGLLALAEGKGLDDVGGHDVRGDPCFQPYQSQYIRNNRRSLIHTIATSRYKTLRGVGINFAIASRSAWNLLSAGEGVKAIFCGDITVIPGPPGMPYGSVVCFPKERFKLCYLAGETKDESIVRFTVDPVMRVYRGRVHCGWLGFGGGAIMSSPGELCLLLPDRTGALALTKADDQPND